MDASHVETKPTDLKDRVECGLFVSMKGRGWKMGEETPDDGFGPFSCLGSLLVSC